MKKPVFENIALKLIALVLAIITWFYISTEMKSQTIGTGMFNVGRKQS